MCVPPGHYTTPQTLESGWKLTLTSCWLSLVLAFYHSNHQNPTSQRYDLIKRNIAGSKVETELP